MRFMGNDIEGETYLCNWSKSGRKFLITIVGKSEWNASGASFEEAEAELTDLIERKTGDLRPNFEYEPERPGEVIQAKFEGCGILAVSGANDSEDFAGKAEELFTGGICPACRNGVGKRTGVSLRISGQPPLKTDGAFVRVRIGGPFVSFTLQIFSAEFMAALSKEERGRFEWLPVESEKKSGGIFFEPISRPLADKVMPKNLFQEKNRLQDDGICCQKCGRKELLGIPKGGGGIYTFLCEDDLPRPIPSCFQAGQVGALELCMLKTRWVDLKGGKGTRRIMSRQVGMVKSDLVNRSPMLEVVAK
jgi:hypothetical protein